MRSSIEGQTLNGLFGASKKLSEFSAETYKVADSVLDSLLTPNRLVPSQWAGLRRRRLQSKDLYLLWGVFISAWQDLASTDYRIRVDAAKFFTMADAGEPVSLRFLCDVFELDLSAVQVAARLRIETSATRTGRRNRKGGLAVEAEPTCPAPAPLPSHEKGGLSRA